MQNDKKKKILIGVSGLCVVFMCALGFAYYSTLPPSRPPVPSVAKTEKPKIAPSFKKAVPSEEQTKPSGSVAVAPITEYDPSTVYSGSLGEVTSLLAGRELSKVGFDMRQNEIKLKELEGKLIADQVGFFAPPTPVQSEQPEVKKVAPKAPEVFAVVSVMGSGRDLRAVVRSKSGKYSVKRGDTIPGLGKISSITPDKVEVDGQPLPWM